MQNRPDQIAAWNVTQLTEEVSVADQAYDIAKSELEAAEALLKAARSKYAAAKEYQSLIRNFTRDLLSTRDEKAQERIRAKYQRRLANYSEILTRSDEKLKSRQAVEGEAASLMEMVQGAAEKIAAEVAGKRSDDATKSAAATVVQELQKKNGNGGGGGDPIPQPT